MTKKKRIIIKSYNSAGEGEYSEKSEEQVY
jgi:hypothetical protein